MQAPVCELCGKEPASVLIFQKTGDAERQQALCFSCAKEKNIPSVADYMANSPQSGSDLRLCARCGRQPGTVFVTNIIGGQEEQEAICIRCAKKQNLPQFREYLAHTGMTGTEIRHLNRQLKAEMNGNQPETLLQRLRRKIRTCIHKGHEQIF